MRLKLTNAPLKGKVNDKYDHIYTIFVWNPNMVWNSYFLWKKIQKLTCHMCNQCLLSNDWPYIEAKNWNRSSFIVTISISILFLISYPALLCALYVVLQKHTFMDAIKQNKSEVGQVQFLFFSWFVYIICKATFYNKPFWNWSIDHSKNKEG